MASSLPQQALDLAVGVETRITQLDNWDSKQNVFDLCTAIQLLAQNALSATPSTDTPDPGTTTTDVATTTAVTSPPPS